MKNHDVCIKYVDCCSVWLDRIISYPVWCTLIIKRKIEKVTFLLHIPSEYVYSGCEILFPADLNSIPLLGSYVH